MTSDSETMYVWVYLADQVTPTLCARVKRSVSTSGVPQCEFVYQKAYLDQPLAIALDPVLLPLKALRYTSFSLNGHFSVLLDAGPDSWGRREITLSNGTQTDFGYLLHGTGDQVGALAFSKDAAATPANAEFNGYPCATLEQLLEFSEMLEKNLPIPKKYETLLRVGTSAGGARPKATILHKGRQWLAKFPSTSDPVDLPSNPRLEKTALDLAEIAGLDVPQRELIVVADKDVLLVERFDRHYHGDTAGGWSRYPYASARTVFYSKPEVQRYAITNSYQRLALELATWSNKTASNRLELFKRMVFNCLVNNLDDHDLNHGLINRGQGFELSPLFDVVPQRPTGARPRLALSAGAAGGAATKQNLLSECERFGLSVAAANHIIDSLRDIVQANWEKCLMLNGISRPHIERVAPAFCSPHFDCPDLEN
ncbi:MULTISPECIES: HipA domain-containing protein [unclassified Undibacterium]|uniref:type II toxin-antitoxin system HipA family toxin n=1 Tax=unclassified Undibacterium TaxID=2630295 RepID=UPI002AC92EAD|nr:MULTISPECIES: HipA domain-containing protein [unclassified Undibacterium]MEB0141225.1 HipA domain-containing protein [Undibacterium sp. CCC2.1]MEB0174228.1 HipA domain-containing protein [Undibacterium sp. CCC1.1]MEB0178167.1 HipA domain-containing protein [Undibacterium sp. CCC3.4]MEB0217373.1 HipA domain-containing protein [Undibacterium sp. 5I2]WPX42140.1 HipA domain-containing protein [Undibacterium sp. CCC3.4]